MITYSIKESNEDPKKSLITKSGIEVDFTLESINTNKAYLDKRKKELEAELKVSQATMENIKRTHPHIADMKLEDLTAAYLYRDASGTADAAHNKIVDIERAFSDYDSEKSEIEKQTGIKIDVPVEKSKTE